MKALVNGLIAGSLSGSLIGTLFFIDAGPGGLLHTPARWLSLDNPTTSGKWIGLLLLLVLGALFGVLFSLTQRRGTTRLGRSLLFGILTGVTFWVVIPFLLEIVLKNHGFLDLGGFLWTFVPLLIYGVALGSIYYQRTGE
jgi:lipopolysaccharide export LptBFGC system permease protein LptF